MIPQEGIYVCLVLLGAAGAMLVFGFTVAVINLKRAQVQKLEADPCHASRNYAKRNPRVQEICAAEGFAFMNSDKLPNCIDQIERTLIALSERAGQPPAQDSTERPQP